MSLPWRSAEVRWRVSLGFSYVGDVLLGKDKMSAITPSLENKKNRITTRTIATVRLCAFMDYLLKLIGDLI